MELPDGQILGYCTNVHAYDGLDGLLAVLSRDSSALRTRLVAAGRLDPAADLGVGLWFPQGVAREVAADPGRLRAALATLQLRAFTVNAFPWGDFHAARVKDAVFRPSWSDPERLRYTLEAAQALAGLLPDGAVGSLSTHSGAHKSWPPAERDVIAIARGFAAAAAGLARLSERSGRKLVLAIEPEPCSLLETTGEVIETFTRHLLAAGGTAARAHLGVCFDACHQAVEHESMAEAVGRLASAGIPLAKVQLSSALVAVPDTAARELLAQHWADARWSHQVVARDAQGGLVRHADLPVALAAADAAAAAGRPPDREWRIHFHVPIHAAQLGTSAQGSGILGTTQAQLAELLTLVASSEVTPHLEIETYSFAAVPQAERRALGADTLVDGLTAEFEWVLDRLCVPRAVSR